MWFKWSEAEECAGRPKRTTAFPQGLGAWEVGWQTAGFPVPADALLLKASSVAHVAVLVSYDPQEVEAECQQGGAQQVTQSCQVRDGKTVWIFATPPHGVYHPVCYGQQQQHLEEKEGGRLDRHFIKFLISFLSERTALQPGGAKSRSWFIHFKLLIIKV